MRGGASGTMRGGLDRVVEEGGLEIKVAEEEVRGGGGTRSKQFKNEQRGAAR